MATLFKTCPLFLETLKKHGTEVISSFEEFKATKEQNAMTPFGKKDYPFIGDGVLGKHKPRLIHAGMTRDISLVYTLTGNNPHVLNLYGFFTHAELGTGNPGKPNIQKSFVKRADNQSFG